MCGSRIQFEDRRSVYLGAYRGGVVVSLYVNRVQSPLGRGVRVCVCTCRACVCVCLKLSLSRYRRLTMVADPILICDHHVVRVRSSVGRVQ